MGSVSERVVFCPYQGVGHVNPAVVFAEKLGSEFGVASRILIGGGGGELFNNLTNSHKNNSRIAFELLEFEEENEKSHDCRQISNGVRNLQTHDLGKPFDNHAEAACKRLKEFADSNSAPICVLLDFCFLTSEKISCWAQDLKARLQICLFSPLSAGSLVLMFGGMEKLLHWDAEKCAIVITNMPPFFLRDISDVKEMAQMGETLNRQIKLFDTIVFNSCEELEAGPLLTLRTFFQKSFAKNLYAVGPLLANTYFTDEDAADSVDRDPYKEWLDLQPPASVLFICFGSWIQLSQEQTFELAMGLESSEHKFLWVVPSDDQAAMLPEGFKERTANQGHVAVGWAPQKLILSHASTGAFVTVCGWNSVLESTSLGGIPMLCWPMFGDQLSNCRFIVDGMKIGVEVIGDGKAAGLVRRDEVERAVKRVMENVEMRQRARELKDAVRREGKEFNAFVKDMII